MELDPLEPKTKDPNMRSFTVRPIDPVGKAFKEAGIGFEFAEKVLFRRALAPSHDKPPLTAFPSTDQRAI